MEIYEFHSYEEMSRMTTGIILKAIGERNDLLLCTATGGSPTGTYEMLAREFQQRPELFSNLQVVKLDEWGGVPPTQPGTCEAYLQQHLIGPLQISQSRYLSFDSNPEDPEEECKAMSKKLTVRGPIDICILGLGRNGHLALNEPADHLKADCHVAQLSTSSLQHSMTLAMPQKPDYGLTLGMADILASRMIILLVSGKGKEKITKQLLTKKITTHLPASFLWLHPNTMCLIDRESVKH